jgi:hypothetical protein
LPGNLRLPRAPYNPLRDPGTGGQHNRARSEGSFSGAHSGKKKHRFHIAFYSEAALRIPER